MQPLRYPIKNIGPQDDYFKIQVIKYEPPDLKLTGGFALRTTEEALQQSGNIKIPEATIILPMPANIQDNNAADWTSGSMNPIEGTLTTAASSAVLSRNVFGSLAKSVKNIGLNIEGAVSSGEGQKGIAASTAFAAVKAALGQGDINQIISRATGNVFNQNIELLFNGVTLRPAFQFSFDMVPRSKSESEMIKKIIRIFALTSNV